MAFDGSGTFARLYDWVTDKANSVPITASRFDAEMDGMATGLSTAICKDGQSTTTAFIPFAQGVKLGDGTVSAPGFTFISDTNSGLYRIGADNIGLTLGGTKIVDYSSTGVSVTGNDTVSGDSLITGSLTVGAGPVGANIIGGYLDWTVNSNALTVAIKNNAGNDPSSAAPVSVYFRSVTAADGQPAALTLTAALSVTVSSGSTLGATSATAMRVWCVCFNDGGTARLGVIVCWDGSAIYPLGSWGIASSTAEGGAGTADSANVFYTGSAVSSKAYCVVGYGEWTSGLTTAGTWDAAPDRMQPYLLGVKLPGDIVQTVVDTYATNTSFTTYIPSDDTIPQNTEGVEIISNTLSNVSAANVCRNDWHVVGSTASADGMTAAIFLNSVADAFDMTEIVTSGASARSTIDGTSLKQHNVSGSVAFKLRCGANSSTFYFNGSATRIGGGAQKCYLISSEIMT